MKIPVHRLSTLFVSALLLPWTVAADNPKQESSLGVMLVEIPLPPNPAAGPPARNAILIQQVLPNGAAARAGVLPGDIILSVDDFPVLGASDVTHWVESRTAREGVTLTILRRDWLGQYVPMPVRVLLPSGAVGSAPPPPTAQLAPLAPGSGIGKQRRVTAAWLGVTLNLKTQPVKTHFNENHTCYAIAPPDWSVWGHRKEGDAVDLGAPDFSYAGWSILSVPGSMQTLPEYATPETYINLELSNHFLGQHLRVTYGEPIQDEFGYIWLPYVKEEVKPPAQGVYIYRVFPVSHDPRGYILISRIAQMPKQLWERKGALALMVALSIRCNVQLHASPDHPAGPRSDDDKEESTFNQQLGTEYAHNPETGEIYWMNHASDWKEMGPQGPGYYIRSGNEWKKLEQGLGR